MTHAGKLDKGFWVVALSAALTLSGVGVLVCPTARAGSAAPAAARTTDHAPTEASKTALTLQSDDDGDELLEHWSEPKYAQEMRLQTVAIVGVLAGTGGITAYRRRSARKAGRRG